MPTESHGATPSATDVPCVLLVDDERRLLNELATVLRRAGFVVVTAREGREAIELMASSSFDVVVSDIGLPGMDGLSLLRAIRAKDLDVPVVFLTGSPSLQTAVEAMEYGAFRYLRKPIDLEKLIAVVQQAARTHRLALARREACHEIEGKAIGDRAGLLSRFAAALETIWIAKQPIVSWRTKSVYGYEALLRTDEPTLQSPLDFVDTAERLSRTTELGRRVRRFIADELINIPSSVNVFVNIHPSDLVDQELASSEGVLSPYAHGVVLEVSERSTLVDGHKDPGKFDRRDSGHYLGFLGGGG
jgi:CheY-like chemotaxis protein